MLRRARTGAAGGRPRSLQASAREVAARPAAELAPRPARSRASRAPLGDRWCPQRGMAFPSPRSFGIHFRSKKNAFSQRKVRQLSTIAMFWKPRPPRKYRTHEHGVQMKVSNNHDDEMCNERICFGVNREEIIVIRRACSCWYW